MSGTVLDTGGFLKSKADKTPALLDLKTKLESQILNKELHQ